MDGEDHGERLTRALQELRGARKIAEHNPTNVNQQTVRVCEEHLNTLLDEQERRIINA